MRTFTAAQMPIHAHSVIIDSLCMLRHGLLMQASLMRGHFIPGLVIIAGVQAGGPCHDQPQPGCFGEDDIQHKHKGRFAIPVEQHMFGSGMADDPLAQKVSSVQSCQNIRSSFM